MAIVDHLDLPRCDPVEVHWGRPDKLRKKVRLAYGSIVLRPVSSTIHVRLTVTVVHYSRAILLVGDGEKSRGIVVRRSARTTTTSQHQSKSRQRVQNVVAFRCLSCFMIHHYIDSTLCLVLYQCPPSLRHPLKRIPAAHRISSRSINMSREPLREDLRCDRSRQSLSRKLGVVAVDSLHEHLKGDFIPGRCQMKAIAKHVSWAAPP